MPVYTAQDRTPKELMPGVLTRTFWGEKVLLSLVDLAPRSYVPPHSHPHEQAGYILEGEIEITIAGETHHLKAGEIFVVPGDVEHSVRTGERPAQVLDIFSPVREEYKFEQ